MSKSLQGVEVTVDHAMLIFSFKQLTNLICLDSRQRKCANQFLLLRKR